MIKKLMLALMLACSLTLTACEKEQVDDSPIVVVDPSKDKEVVTPDMELIPNIGESENKEETVEPEQDKEETIEHKEDVVAPEKSDEIFVSFDGYDIPMFNGNDPYIVLNDNQPNFSKEDLAKLGVEEYTDLDSLGRVGTAFAVLGKETMPLEGEERGAIGMVKPSGWQTARYDDLISTKYLYNRCHLIGWQLSAENANKMNLMTGTRYLNIDGTLIFENMVADYIKETNNHVAYRVTPVFVGENLVAHGIQIEAYSVEDNGEGICFNVFSYNVQPGINIDYKTGESSVGKLPTIDESTLSEKDKEIVYKTPSGSKYHKNKEHAGDNAIETKRYLAEKEGLEPCKVCYKDELK